MKERVITGVIGGAGFLALLWLGGIWYTALIYLLAIGSFYEYVRMRKSNWVIPSGIVGLIILLLILSVPLNTFTIVLLAWITVFLLLLFTVASKNEATIVDIGYLLIGLVYISLGFYFMKAVRIEYGLEWALMAVALVWSTDTGAYFSGRFFGKHKLWPAISPKKTIEGSIGGTILAVAVAVLFYYIGNSIMEINHAIMIGLVIAVVAQLGDLIESAMKRTFNVKDSGRILPGHGGFLDRFDSMIAVFPVMYYLIMMFS